MSELLQLLAPQFAAHFSGIAFYATLILLGLMIGFLTGFFGVGGGFLTVPLLNIVLGVPYEIAVGSDLSFIIGTSSSGFLRQATLGKVEYKTVGCIAGGSIAGAVVGDILQDFLIFSVAGGQRAVFNSIMHSLFVALLLFTVFIILKRPGQEGGPKAQNGDPNAPGPISRPRLTPLQRLHFGPKVDLNHDGLEQVNLFGMILIGFLVGILTGVMGIGGGVLMVPILLLLVGLPADKASGTSLGIVFLAASAGVMKKAISSTPKISLPITMSLLVASVIGVQIGIHLVQNFDTSRFRRYFALIVIGAVGLILFDLIIL